MERKVPSKAAGRAAIAPSLLALAALGAFVVPGAAEHLRFDRAAVAAGEVWRILTCHLVHASPELLFWDVAATFALGVALTHRSLRLFLGVAGAAAVLIPLGVWIGLPSMTYYGGLSGIASALFAAYAVLVFREGVRERRYVLSAAIAVVAVAFGAKLLIEATTGAAVFVDVAAVAVVPVPLAHLLGAAAGSSVVAVSRRGSRRDPEVAPDPA